MASAAAKRPQEELQARGKKLQASFFLRSEEGKALVKAGTNMEGKVVEGNAKEGNASRTGGVREEWTRKRMRKWMEVRAAERKAGKSVEPAAEDTSEDKEVLSTGGRIILLTSPEGKKAESEAAATEGKASDTSGKTDALEGKAAATEGKASDTSGKTDTLEGKAAATEGKASDTSGKTDTLEGKATV